MRHSRLRAATGVVGLTVALAVSGCGGAAPAAPAGKPAAAPTAKPSAATRSGGGLLARVASTKQLTVALAPFAPLEYQRSSTKTWAGFDIDMLGAFAQTLHAKLVVNALPFAATIQAVAARRDDITANIFKTAKRAKVLAFSGPVLNYVDGVIVNSQHPAITGDTLKALSGKRIGTCRGCAEQRFVPKIPKAQNVSYSTADDSFLAVSTGRVAAAFQPVMYAQYALFKNPSLKIKVLGPIPKSIAGKAQKPQGFYAVAKGGYSKAFLAKLNAFIVRSCKNGKTAGILKKYGLDSASYLKGLC